MKHPRLTSRPSFKARAEQPQGLAIPQPTFNPIASNTTFGPLTDLSMGWDGTLWGIDAQGAPHVYDALNDAWVQHGDGIDAAATTPDNSTAYFFKGREVISLNLSTMQASPPQPIGSLWPNLPDSFKLGVSGACTGVGGAGSLTLFNGGRYVSTDGALPLSKLTAIPGWPQTPNWKDGLFDAIYAGPIGQGWFHVVSNGEFMLVDPAGQGRILEGPGPFSQTEASKAVPAAWGAELDCGIALIISGAAAAWYFRGTAMASSAATPAQLQYLGNLSASWPATWHPVLRHAPSGRDGNLWSVLATERGSWILQHNGDAWTQVKNQADHVGVGQDNAVMIASAQRLWRFTGAFDGTGFTPVSPASNLIQVSLGNVNAVFVRDSGNNVYSFDPASGALTQSPNAGMATHIAATSDGTLWHAKPNDPNLHRLLTTSDLPAQAINVQQDLTAVVTKVAATGFGAAHCLAQDSQGNAQAYRYDSPYVFASANNYFVSALGSSQMAQGLGNVYFVEYHSNSVVAVDVHTGAEASRSAPSSADGSILYTNVIFDVANQLVYVGTYNSNNWLDRTTPGRLLALDAHDLSKVVWSFNATAGINIRPSLVGNVLLFGDRNATIYAFDTLAAAAAPANVLPRATWTLEQINLSSGMTHTGVPDGGMATFAPAIAVGGKYFLSLCFSFDLRAGMPFFVDHFCAVWLEAGVTGPQSYNTNEFHFVNIQYPQYPLGILPTPWLQQATPPVVANILTEDSSKNRQTCLFADCADAVVRINPDSSTKQFAMPTGSTVQTGLGWDADAATVWFGDNNGNLYGLDANLEPLAHTPALIAPESPMSATPLPYTDPRGNKTVFVGVSGQTDYGSLFGFDPISGNLASVQTGVTQILSLSPAVTQGVLYVGGGFFSQTDLTLTPQVWGAGRHAHPGPAGLHHREPTDARPARFRRLNRHGARRQRHSALGRTLPNPLNGRGRPKDPAA